MARPGTAQWAPSATQGAVNEEGSQSRLPQGLRAATWHWRSTAVLPRGPPPLPPSLWGPSTQPEPPAAQTRLSRPAEEPGSTLFLLRKGKVFFLF